MSDMKRQHPVMIPLGAMRGLVYIFPPLVIALIQNIGAEDLRRGLLIILLVALGSLAVSFGYQVLNWYFYAYRYEDGFLHLKTGVIIKKERSIKKERIQTVNIRRGLIQRLFGLASLQVQTAGAGGETEFNLAAITLDEAVQIKESLESKKEFRADSELQAEEIDNSFSADQYVRGSGLDLLLLDVTFQDLTPIALLPRFNLYSRESWVDKLTEVVGLFFLFAFLGNQVYLVVRPC